MVLQQLTPPGLSSAKLMSLRGPTAPAQAICRKCGRQLWELPPQRWKAGEEARNSHVVPNRVGQDDDAALTFLQVLGSPHSDRHGTTRAAAWMGTKKREIRAEAAQGAGSQSQCEGHGTAPANSAVAPRQSSSRGGTLYSRAAQDARSGRTIGPTAL